MWESRVCCLHKSEQNRHKWPYLDSSGTLRHAQRCMGIFISHFCPICSNRYDYNKDFKSPSSALTSLRMLWSTSLSRRSMMASWGQLPGACRTVRVREFVPGQNLSMQELSDHTVHTPGAEPTTGPGGLMRREKDVNAPCFRIKIIGNEVVVNKVNLLRTDKSLPYE